jgi:hypothetical protein
MLRNFGIFPFAFIILANSKTVKRDKPEPVCSLSLNITGKLLKYDSILPEEETALASFGLKNQGFSLGNRGDSNVQTRRKPLNPWRFPSFFPWAVYFNF